MKEVTESQFSTVRITGRLRKGEKRRGGEDVELVSIDIALQEGCCKREQRMM